MSPRVFSRPDSAAPRRGAYWPGLLGAPALVLAYESIQYALVPYACQSQRHGLLHLVSALAIALLLALFAQSVRDYRIDAAGETDRHRAVPARRRFLAEIALAVCALSLLAALGMGFAALIVPPCVD